MAIDDALLGDDAWIQPTQDSIAAGLTGTLTSHLLLLTFALVVLATLKPGIMRQGWWWLLTVAPVLMLVFSGPLSRLVRIFL